MDYSGDGTAAAVDEDDDDDKFSLGRAVGIVVVRWVEGPGDVGSMPNMGRYVFPLHRPYWLWIPHSLLSDGHWGKTTEA